MPAAAVTAKCDGPLRFARASTLEFAQPFDHFQLRDHPRQLGERLGLGDLVRLPREGFLGTLAREKNAPGVLQGHGTVVTGSVTSGSPWR